MVMEQDFSIGWKACMKFAYVCIFMSLYIEFMNKSAASIKVFFRSVLMNLYIRHFREMQ